ncbi:hypothetical protein AWH48_16370 [Domibacillus aminovorans]|uniref:Uncharacterized protein n=1 Tax=Domibacillus aminovorans TaxID=29332 RepID=A0A177L1A0_9BACI|nr:hypothetical protein [Domibacillus aminovorans]OAH59162.1 hypothetical protein AWH48_16370 [Domibacillus aminovorans]
MDLFYILGAVLVTGFFFTSIALVDGKKRYDDGFEAGYKKALEEGYDSLNQKKSRFRIIVSISIFAVPKEKLLQLPIHFQRVNCFWSN